MQNGDVLLFSAYGRTSIEVSGLKSMVNTWSGMLVFMACIVTVAFSYIVFHEKLSKKSAIGLVGIVAGTLIMLIP